MSTKKNPKELAGAKKASLASIPPVALMELGRVCEIGAAKYGRFNWTESHIVASTYYDAILRHLLAWYTREEKDGEDGMSHMSHIMACTAIIIDAQHIDKMVDDRPKHTATVREVMEQIKESKKDDSK